MKKLVQFMTALDYGDAVSTDVINLDTLFKEMGIKTDIYTLFSHYSVNQFCHHVEEMPLGSDTVILYHYTEQCEWSERILKSKAKKIMVFHNMTPVDFFQDYNAEISRHITDGIKFLEDNGKYFDEYIADSSFNKQNLVDIGISPSQIDVVPILFNMEEVLGKYERDLVGTLSGIPIILCVGRIAPNKKQEDILDLFEYYWKNISKDTLLVFAGNMSNCSEYSSFITKKKDKLKSKGNIIFTDKLTNTYLNSYYMAADLVISLSEHEGFCVPLIEAMKYKVPVVAYESCAQPETMGGAGILIKKKTVPEMAYLLNVIIRNKGVRKTIIDKQNKRLEEFYRNNMKRVWSSLIRKWGI